MSFFDCADQTHQGLWTSATQALFILKVWFTTQNALVHTFFYHYIWSIFWNTVVGSSNQQAVKVIPDGIKRPCSRSTIEHFFPTCLGNFLILWGTLERRTVPRQNLQNVCLFFSHRFAFLQTNWHFLGLGVRGFSQIKKCHFCFLEKIMSVLYPKCQFCFKNVTSVLMLTFLINQKKLVKNVTSVFEKSLLSVK